MARWTVDRRTVIGGLHWAPLLAVILWGGVYPSIKIGLREIPPFPFMYLRVVLAAAVLMAVSSLGGWPGGGGTARRAAALPRSLWAPLAGAGCGQAAFQFLLIEGTHRTTAGTAAILLATAPLLTAAWEAARRVERLSLRRLTGIALGLVGVVLVVWGTDGGPTRPQLEGALLMLGATVAWVWFSVAIGPVAGMAGSIRATGWASVISLAVLSPLALAGAGRGWHTAPSWVAWGALAYNALVGLVIATVLWSRSVHLLGPTQTMLYVYLEPVSAVLISAAVLGEALTPLKGLGAVVIFAGVWLGSLPSGGVPRGAGG